MAPCIAIAAHQAERGWRQEEIAANIQDEESPNEVLTPTASDDVAAVDKDNGMEGLDDTQIALRIGQPRLTAAAVNRAKKVAPRTRTPTLSTSAAEAASVGEKVAAAGQEPQQPQTRQHSPLGCLFRPELDKAEVIDVVSDVVCRPGFTRGPGDDRRLLKSVRTGRVDVRCMSRLLRWLAGDRVARELRERGVEFIGPKGLEAAEPYTTGQGMQRLVQEVIAGGHPAGSHFIVCFSSRFDACSSAIAGVLVDASSLLSGSISEALGSDPGSRVVAGDGYSGGGALSHDTRTPSTCSWSSDTDDDATPFVPSSPTGGVVAAAAAVAAAAKGVCTASAVGAENCADRAFSSSSSSSNSSSIRGGSAESRHGDMVALLLDEMPKHCRRGGVNAHSGGPATGCVADESDGGVYGMRVSEWVEAYGECDGPMLAAWVFPGNNLSRVAR